MVRCVRWYHVLLQHLRVEKYMRAGYGRSFCRGDFYRLNCVPQIYMFKSQLLLLQHVIVFGDRVFPVLGMRLRDSLSLGRCSTTLQPLTGGF